MDCSRAPSANGANMPVRCTYLFRISCWWTGRAAFAPRSMITHSTRCSLAVTHANGAPTSLPLMHRMPDCAEEAMRVCGLSHSFQLTATLTRSKSKLVLVCDQPLTTVGLAPPRMLLGRLYLEKTVSLPRP